MGLQVIRIESPEATAQTKSLIDTDQGPQAAIQSYQNYFGGVAGGQYSADLDAYVGAVQATATMTSTGAATATETFSLCNVEFEAVASGATGNQFNVSGTVATQAANIAAAINGSSDLTNICTATSLLGVVTITAYMPGISGNALQFSEGLSNVTITQFTGGTNGTAVDMDFN